MNKLRIHVAYFTVALVASLAAFPAAAQCNDGREGVLSDAFVGSNAVEWRMLVEHKAVTLTISAPCGLVVERTYGEGQSPFFDLREIPAADPDGTYHWSLRISPHVDPAVAKELKAAHESGDGRDLEYQFRQKGLLPAGPFTQSGTFTVFRGSIVPPDQKEEGAGGKLTAGVRPASSVDDCPVAAAPAVQTARLGTILPAADRGGSTRAVAAAAETPRRITGADQVIPDDLIVQGSACVGFDCVNNEAFSFDTIRLKENNLRIKFEDTSVGSFPTTDWELIANDSTSGGAGKFSIRDVTGNTIPFTVRAGSPANSLFVASTGRIGMRTSSPVLDLHISTSNTPGIRLEQTNAGGFTAQTWDIAGNEANFFVRDVTGGSRLPFRIRPGAPTSAIDISGDGEVGIRTASPDAELTVQSQESNSDVVTVRASGGTDFLFRVFEASTGEGVFSIFDSNNVENIRLTGQAQGRVAIGCASGLAADLTLNAAGGGACGGGTESTINAGATAFTVTSSRTIKENIEPVAVDGILDKIADVGVYTYDFINGPSDNLGLMAEDFHEIFGRGSDKLLNGQEIDMALWLAVKELVAQNKGLAAQNEELRRAVEQLDSRVSQD